MQLISCCMLLFVELSASLMLMLIFSFVVTMISSVSSIDLMLEMCLSYDFVLHSGQEEGGDSYRYSLRVSVI